MQGEEGIRTLETVIAVYSISNAAPSTSSATSPNDFTIISVNFKIVKGFLKNLFFLRKKNKYTVK